MSLTTAVESGDYRESLVELRNTLAAQIDTCDSARDVAALSRQLMLVLEELNNIPEKEGVSDADRIRRERNAAPSGPANTAH